MGNTRCAKGNRYVPDLDCEWGLDLKGVLEQGVELRLVAIDEIVFEAVEVVWVTRLDMDFVEGDSFHREPTWECAFLRLGVAVGIDSHQHAFGFANVDHNAGLAQGVNATAQRFANVVKPLKFHSQTSIDFEAL
jgi:hypothetical protein